jgi:hypothetical protein
MINFNTKMTNTTPSANGLKSITGLTDQEYEALSAALAKMRAPKAGVAESGAHSKMLSAVRSQLQQRLNNASHLSDDEKTKLMHDIAELDRKMYAL